MLAVYYDEFQKTPWLQQVPEPQPGDCDVVLEVKASGLCRSDWHGWMGHDPDISLPHVPGHEFAGVVVKKGKAVRNFSIGQRVTAPFIQACGRCAYCRQGDQQVCNDQAQAGFSYWGSFASHMLLKRADDNLVVIPDPMSYEDAALLGCRFGTAYRAIVRQSPVKKKSYVVIFGAGGLGLSALLICRALGAHTCVVDPSLQAREVAKAIGADLVVNAFDEHLIENVVSWSEGGAHVTLDGVGSSAVLNPSLACLRRRGRHLQVGLLTSEETKWDRMSNLRIVAHELEIVGCHGIQAHEYQGMMEFINEAQINLSQLITARKSLADVPDYFFRPDSTTRAGVSMITEFPH